MYFLKTIIAISIIGICCNDCGYFINDIYIIIYYIYNITNNANSIKYRLMLIINKEKLLEQ